MDIVSLLPGELLVGYRGRLAVLNHCERSQQIHRMLQQHFPPEQEFAGAGIVPSISEALRVPVKTLLRERTVYPLFAAFAQRDAFDAPNKSPYSDSFSSIWLKLARPRLALCPTCVEQDLDTRDLHISYWRRCHQVPGLFHCQVHGTELLFIEAPELLTARPDTVLQKAKPGPVDAVEAAKSNPFARHATSLLEAVLQSGQTVSREEITSALKIMALAGRSSSAIGETVRSVSRHISDAVPSSWLADFMPYTKARNPERLIFVTAALASATFSLSAAAVALLLALFGIREEAARAIMFTDVQNPPL